MPVMACKLHSEDKRGFSSMEILSNYKDYYDYLAYQYGVDDHIVFQRNKAIPIPADFGYLYLPECYSPSDKVFRPQNEPYAHAHGSTNWLYYETKNKICQFEIVSIVGTIYIYLYEYDKTKRIASM